MKNFAEPRLFLKKYSPILLGFLPATFVIFLLFFMLLRFPETAAQGISDGIDLSLGTLIPSLYPFMVLSSLITDRRIFDILCTTFSKLTNKLFALDGKCLGVIVMSMFGGIPIGCKMSSELFENGDISRSQSRRMMLFCFCCGPAFTISSVGLYMLGSKQAGLIIYISLILSSLCVGILSRFFEDDDNFYRDKKHSTETSSFSLSLVRSVSSGSTAMLSVCAWVMLFSCIRRIIEILPINDSVKFFSYCILEVTNGAYSSAGYLPLPIIAGIIGFGGICSHCQVMPYIIKVHLKYKYFLVSRIICGALAVVFCNLLLEFFPVSYDVFSMGTLPSKTSSGVSASVSIAMLFTAGLFLLGDSAVIKLKRYKKDKSHRN